MRRNTRIMLSILISAAAIISTFGYIHFYAGVQGQNQNRWNLPALDLGPKLAVSVNNPASNPSAENNTTITLQVFGLLPHRVSLFQTVYTNFSGLNCSDNGYDIQLLNITVIGDSETVFLSPLFLSVAEAWQNFFGDPSGNVGTDYPSLTVEASKSVYLNGSVYVYPYFGSLLYNPEQVTNNLAKLSYENSLSVTSWFNGTSVNLSQYSSVLYTNLEFPINLTFPSTPSHILRDVGPLPSMGLNSMSARKPVSASSPGSYYYWKTSFSEYKTVTGTVTINGYLPLLAVHMGRGTDYGGSEIALGAGINLQDTTIGIDSTQTSWTETGQVTSSLISGPSYEHTANASFESINNAYVANPLNLTERLGNNYSVSINRTTAYIAFQNATYTFVHYSINESEYNNEYLVTWHLKPIWIDGKEYWMNVSSTTLEQSILVNATHIGNASQGGITSITQSAGKLQLVAGYLPIVVNEVMQNISEQRPSSNLSITASGPGYSISAGSFWTSDSAWTNAIQVIRNLDNPLASFAVGLSAGLAITSALSPGGIWGEPAIVGEIADIFGSALSLVSIVAGQLNTIGFVANAEWVPMGYSVTNVPAIGSGSNYRFVYYEGESQMQETLNGKVYQFYAPSNYINMTEVVNVTTITNNRFLSSPENTSLSTSGVVYQSTGVWKVDPSNDQVEFASYSISPGAQYMAGSVFNQWQNFAFQPGDYFDGYSGVIYDVVGTVYVDLINYQNAIVASWQHTFNQYFTGDNGGSDWVYINPTFTIPNDTVEPIQKIQFVNDISSFEPGWSFTGIGNGGLISFANANGSVDSLNNPEPAGNYESGLGWYGYTPQNKTASWSAPASTVNFMIVWSSPYYTEVTYNGETQYGTEGMFFGELGVNSLSVTLGCWIQDSEVADISEFFEIQ